MKVKSVASSLMIGFVILLNTLFLSSTHARSISNACGRGCGRRYSTSLGLKSAHYPHHLTRSNIFDHMSEVFSFPVYLNSLLDQQQRQLSNVFYNRQSPPQYDISETKDNMEISFDLPGVRASDISIVLQDHGRVLKVSGARKFKGPHGEIIQSEFDQMFTIDPNVLDVSRVEARIQDGVLLISAPRSETKDRHVAIKVKEGETALAEQNNDEVGAKGKDESRGQEVSNGEENSSENVDIVDELEISNEEDI